MSLSPPSIVERISELPKAERDALILSLSAEKALALRYDWPSWARPNQLPPPGSWSYWMVKAGRGFGKTRTGSETLRQRIKDGVKQANIIVRTVGDIEKVLVRSSGGILKVCPPDKRPTWVANKRLFLWPGGATSFVFTAEELDSLRGPECEFLWCFIAGTMIETPDGRRPVEEIRAGDLVSTRFGPRRVIATGNRQAAVGTVAFSDGSELTGTA